MDQKRIDVYRDRYFIYDEPVPYTLNNDGQKTEIKIYPVRMNEWVDFIMCCDILNIDKNSIANPQIISMSYLKFLFNIQFKFDRSVEGTDATYGDLQRAKFQKVMVMCLKEYYVDVREDNTERSFVVIGAKNEENDKDMILKAKITNNEFLEIVDIIFSQNFVNYSNEKLDPTVQKIYDDYIKMQTSGQNEPTLEQKINFIITHSPIKPDEIKDMTYRRFMGVYQCALEESLYFSNRMAEVSYKYDVKKYRDFYLFEKKDKYNGFLLSDERANEIKSQVEFKN